MTDRGRLADHSEEFGQWGRDIRTTALPPSEAVMMWQSSPSRAVRPRHARASLPLAMLWYWLALLHLVAPAVMMPGEPDQPGTTLTGDELAALRRLRDHWEDAYSIGWRRSHYWFAHPSGSVREIKAESSSALHQALRYDYAERQDARRYAEFGGC
jgi:hypothetical protein